MNYSFPHGLFREGLRIIICHYPFSHTKTRMHFHARLIILLRLIWKVKGFYNDLKISDNMGERGQSPFAHIV